VVGLKKGKKKSQRGTTVLGTLNVSLKTRKWEDFRVDRKGGVRGVQNSRKNGKRKQGSEIKLWSQPRAASTFTTSKANGLGAWGGCNPPLQDSKRRMGRGQDGPERAKDRPGKELGAVREQ